MLELTSLDLIITEIRKAAEGVEHNHEQIESKGG